MSDTLSFQKRSSGGTYPDRKKKTARQMSRASQAQERQRREEEEAATLPEWYDDKILNHFATKIDHHRRGIGGARRDDRQGHAEKSYGKWSDRDAAVRLHITDALRVYYDHYKVKENKNDLSVLKRAKATKFKNYYGAKLGIAPDGGQSSSGQRPPSAGQGPDTPAYHYGSAPPTPLFHPDRYTGSNWTYDQYE